MNIDEAIEFVLTRGDAGCGEAAVVLAKYANAAREQELQRGDEMGGKMTHAERRRRREEISAYIDGGGSVREAAKKFGVSATTAYTSSTRRRNYASAQEIAGDIIRYVEEENATVADICVKFNITPYSAKKVLTDCGITMRTGGYRPIPKESSYVALKMMLDGVRQSDIARDLGLSRQRVSQIAALGRRAGFDIHEGAQRAAREEVD